MAEQPINLSGTVISITSGGGAGRRRSRHLLVVQGTADTKKRSGRSHGILRKQQRVYRIRSYEPDKYKIGSAISFKDVQHKMGGYWEAEDLSYTPVNYKLNMKSLSGSEPSSRYRGITGWQERMDAVQASLDERAESNYQRKKYMKSGRDETELPPEIKDDAMRGIDRLIGFIKRKYNHNRVYGDYENPRPASDPVENELSAYVDLKETRTGYANSVAVYKALITVVTGKSLGPARSDGVADSYDLKHAKDILKKSLTRITEEQLEKLERWADRQRR